MNVDKLLPLLVATFLLLSGCVATVPAPTTAESETAVAEVSVAEESMTDESLFPLTITDAAGQEFTFEEPPKIGCIWYGCHEAMADLGIPAHASGLTAETSESVSYSPAGSPANLVEDTSNPELWAAAEVDLIITRVPASADNEALTAAAPIFYLHHPSYGASSQSGYQAYLENLYLLGQLSGQPAAAAAAIARFETMKDNLQALATLESADLTVAILFGGDGYSGLVASNPFCSLLAEVEVGQCPAVTEGGAWLDMNAEQFLALDPDWIIYMGGDNSYTERTDPIWPELTAVKEGRVFDAAGNRYYCCSTRGLIHAFQDYVSHVLPEAGISNPGPMLTFDPTQSPLVQPQPLSGVEALFPLTITDALGQEFTFTEPPIMGCDWYGCYETFADLGLTLHAAAMTPAMLDTVFYAPVGPPDHLIEDLSNPELWAATDVTLLLSRVPDDPYWGAFRQIAPVFFLHHPSYGQSSVTGYQAYIENTRLLGQLTGKTEAADAAIARFETMLDNLKALSTPALAAQTVGLIWSGEGYYSIAADNPVCTVLAEVGLGNCMGTGTGRYVEYNPEEVLALDPDVIIYMLEGGASHTERTDPIWAELTAVKAGRVYDAIGTRYMCCSMRGLIHSLQEYVHHVIPDAGIPAPGPVETFDPTQSLLVER